MSHVTPEQNAEFRAQWDETNARYKAQANLTKQAGEKLREFARVFARAHFRVYWHRGGGAGYQIRVYSDVTDTFADVWLRIPNHAWLYASVRQGSASGLIVVESADLHAAHVMQALHTSKAHPDRLNATSWKREPKDSWERVTG